MKGGGRITWHGGGGGACCVSGGVVALRWKPVVVSSGAIVPTAAPSSAATSPGGDVLPGSLLFFRFLCSLAVSSSPSSQCWVFGVSLLCFGWFSLLFSLFGFFLLRVLSLFFSVFRFSPSFPFLPFGFFVSSPLLSFSLPFGFFVLPLLFFSFLFLLFPLPLFSAFLGSIYRAKGVAFYCSHGEQPAGRSLGATAKVRLPPVFWQVRGRPVCSVGGLRAREGPAKFK